MQVAVEISYYTLTPDYEKPILDFIRQLRSVVGIEVATNQLSTQVAGDYDLVMNSLQAAMKACLAEGPVANFVLKVLNVEIKPGEEVVV